MPTILPPDEHLTAGLSAVQKHIDYHEGELAALRALRRQYKDALGIVTGDRVQVEQPPEVYVRDGESFEDFTARIAAHVAAQPTFDEVVSTMSGRLTVFDEHGRLQV